MAMMCGDNHVPRRCVAILVGQEKERFVIPVTYLNHPNFMVLLKEAEEVYGFRQNGNIILPCDVDDFLNVQGLIEHEIMSTTRSPRHHNHHHFLHGRLDDCFKGLIRLM
ncbi:hypothetical protein MKX01_005086 [Papaver californicum]|nr:hypothetical protein MKX01_005086 [Papaver californicum]